MTDKRGAAAPYHDDDQHQATSVREAHGPWVRPGGRNPSPSPIFLCGVALLTLIVTTIAVFAIHLAFDGNDVASTRPLSPPLISKFGGGNKVKDADPPRVATLERQVSSLVEELDKTRRRADSAEEERARMATELALLSGPTRLGRFPLPALPARLPDDDGCPRNCSAPVHGFCLPVQRRCQCALGRGGLGCEFASSSIFRDHRVYEGFDYQSVKGVRMEKDNARPQGWSNAPPSVYVQAVDKTQARLVIEVGVWKGLSASFLAGQLKRNGGGVLLAIDTWLGALEFYDRRFTGGMHDPTRDLALKNGFPQVYYQFLANMQQLDLADLVIPFPATSTMAAEYMRGLKVQADLIHIDASHEYDQVTQDIVAWLPVLAPGGIMLGDDYEKTYWPGVVRAADEFANKTGLELHVESNKWWVQIPR